MRKFEEGQKVRWNDPVHETLGEYEVIDICNTDITEEDIEGFDDRVILISNGYSEVEVYAEELELVK